MTNNDDNNNNNNQLGLEEIIIPILAWSLLCGQYIYLWYIGAFAKHLKNITKNENEEHHFYAYSFFSQCREGWVIQNYLTGQAAANSTRDYLRVILFFAGNAVLLGLFLVGYAISTHRPEGTARNHMLTAKLGFCAFLFFVIFFLFLYSARYGTHFHFLMNVKTVCNKPLSTRVIQKVFHRSYSYYTAGLRMYFVLIPMFAWMLSAWALLVVVPINLYIVYDYDNLTWVEKDIEEMYNEEKDDIESDLMNVKLLKK